MIIDARGYRGRQQREGREGRRGPYRPDNGAGGFLLALRDALDRLAAPTLDLGLVFDANGYAVIDDDGDIDELEGGFDLSPHTDDEVLWLAFAKAVP